MAVFLVFLRRLVVCLGAALAVAAAAKPVDFNLPAGPATQSLLAFSQQARVEVLFSYDELAPVKTPEVRGRFEPEEALARLLSNTGFAAHRTLTGKFVVARSPHATGALTGRIVGADGRPLAGVTVVLVDTALRTATDQAGAFTFPTVPPGRHHLLAGGSGWRAVEQRDIVVEASQTRELAPLTVQAASRVTELEPYLVKDRADRLLIGEGVGAAPRRAAGNLDLPRTEDNAMPFTIFTRDQIARSGVVQLNEFFRRELLDGNTNTPPPEQDGSMDSFVTGSSNLGLRGYGADETVVLVNGRRLPETFAPGNPGTMGAPDVNLVPLALIQQVEVLPASASALYSGNAVGGVINIILQPDYEGTEVRTTYTNALGGYNAPQSSVSLQWGHAMLGGKLHLRLSATFMRSAPAVESELNYQLARLARPAGLVARATPNIVSADGSPLFGAGTPNFTSVAPGANGSGDLASYLPRAGVYNMDRFDTPGGLAASFNSLDYPYGREQRRSVWYGSTVYDVTPWLQLGLDGSYATTTVHRGYDLFAATFHLPRDSPFNHFGQDVMVALNETAPQLGQDYNEAQLESYSLVGGALLKLPAHWQLSLDGQYARNIARYRGTVGADLDRWQQLVDAGRYNPLRDTQAFGPPQEFYDQALVYYGGPGRFVKLGDYDTFEGTVRATNEALRLPTGSGTVNFGADYRRGHLAPYLQEPRFADGTPAAEIIQWTGRTLERISVFGELQAPLLPARRLPHPLTGVETDLGVRYIVSDQSNETSFAPTLGLKLDFDGGFSVRGSYTTSNRFPSPTMSRPIAAGSGGGSAADTTNIFDPVRNEHYETEAKVAVNPNVRPEAAATQSAGLIWQHGKTHRFRFSLDFADTTKTNEFIVLEAQALMNLESTYPDRVLRDTPPPTPPAAPPRVTTLLVGPANAARRHSQNWSFAAEYAWRDLAGGTLRLRSRWVHFSRYDRQIKPGDPLVDELDHPDGSAPTLIRDRLTLGAGWSKPLFGFGTDLHYISPRILPEAEWAGQGSDHIKEYWQIDAYVQTDLTQWFRGQHDKFRLTAQLRVNNLSGFAFPKYANDPSGAGVQPYGDWRGRTYSLSVAAEF